MGLILDSSLVIVAERRGDTVERCEVVLFIQFDACLEK
jgi:hypothetical protein